MIAPAEQTRTLLSCHKEDLYKSGLTDETIKSAGFYSATREEAKGLLGFDPHSGGWVIPYPSRNGLPDTIQFKPDVPFEGKDGKKRKYLKPFGSTNRVYAPPMIQMEAVQSKRISLLIVEGEKKALKAAQEGLACIAIPGVYGWKYRDELGDSRTIPDLLDSYLKRRNVVICFDSDIGKNNNVQWAEFKLAEKLKQQGAIVSGLRLSPGPDGEKVGLDDYLLAHSVEEFESLPRIQIEYPGNPGMNGNAYIWPEIIPFNDYGNLPGFPADMLPPAIVDMVQAAAKCFQVDTGLAATISLGVLAASMQRKARVNLITHTESLNLYAVSVLPSGERKSAVFKEMTAPVYEFERNTAEEMAPGIRELAINRNILESRLSTAMKAASNPKAKGTGRAELERDVKAINEELDKAEIVRAPKFIVDDITPESLGIVMAENNESLSLFSAEGDLFEILAGRYSSGTPNIALCLKAYSGDNYSVHRVGRKSYQMQEPTLTVCLTCQPDVLTDIGGNKKFRGSGLLARFLFSIGSPQAGHRKRQFTVIPAGIKTAYSRRIKELLSFSPESPEMLGLTPEAHAVWDDFYNDVESSLNPEKQLENLKDWGSKLPGSVARIAGLLHFAEHGQRATRKDITPGTVTCAVAIGRYYLGHALSAFGMMELDAQIESAKKILEYLIDKKPAKFKGRHVLRNKNCFQKMDEVNEGLAILLERHYIREIPREAVKNGRPPAQEYEVNKKLNM